MPKKILLIEDITDMRKLILSRLKSKGYEVIVASDGEEGLRKAESESPDLVLTDYALPKLMGNEIVRHLKGSEKSRHIPIIVLSAYVRRHMEKAVEVPADIYLPKPFDAAELLATIEKLLEKNQASST